MKKFFLVIVLNSLSLNVLFPQTQAVQSNSIQLEWGNNIWGNTINAGYNYFFAKHFGAGISIGSGYFNYDIGDNRNFLFVKSIPGVDNVFSLDFKFFIDLKISYRLNEQHSGLRLFNKYEFGLSYVYLVFKDEFKELNRPGLWRAQKDFSLYSLIGTAGIVEYAPEKLPYTNFVLGVKSRITFQKSPQTVYYENGSSSLAATMTRSGGGSFIWFYPELFLKIIYYF